MKVKQIYELVNDITKEVLGESFVLEENLSNVVDLGKAIIDTDNVDNYVKKLVNHIGKVIFVNRVYAGGAPSVLMDSWEYGSILEKVSSELPTATESDSWKLTDGQTYDPNVFHQPKVSAKFFNNRVTFEIPLSFTERQIKESFSSVNQLNGFLTMLTTSVENSMTVKLDGLVMRTINSMIGNVLLDGLGATLDVTADSIKAVNVLKMYNDAFNETLTVDGALTSADFIRYATYVIGLCSDRMARISTLFNVGGKERFTPKELQHIVLLSDFAKASETFLLSDTRNENRVLLPNHETVPYWQGSGESYDFGSVSAVNVVVGADNKPVEMGGILGVIFDRDALGVSNLDRRVTTNYNPKAEFYTNFYKFDAGFFNDLDENAVVFFIADSPETP